MTQTKNPLIHQDRRLGEHTSDWVRSFSCADMKPLIVCRGPIRKEAIDVFHEMGMSQVGMLLSEKDSIIYTNANAPELREIPPEHVHRIKDYMGTTKVERLETIERIIEIAKTHGYDSVFSGYGFMAEDEGFVRMIEEAGLTFIGPCSGTVKAAGRKDEAKLTALREKVSVTPGVNNLSARTLLKKYPSLEALKELAKSHHLELSKEAWALELPLAADELLNASYRAGLDLYSIDEIAQQAVVEVAGIFEKYPENRVRLKAIGGGGGKGQRILKAPSVDPKRSIQERAEEAAKPAEALLREVLAEVKATGVGDNKNVLIELNIEETRHNEIQLVGNGDWCVALGGRDCSLQMHEQKLLEVSITQEGLKHAIDDATHRWMPKEAEALKTDLVTLTRMEAEGERFGKAVGLDSVSTFECIVERDRHFFMEVNTRIQVEHRVTEMCYKLRFANPVTPSDAFEVESLVEVMALLARHKSRLPRPERVERFQSGVEARLNATNAALQPHAGGLIIHWTQPTEDEIRDDQGICVRNPDSNLFMRYKVAGAYDSNIALLVTYGHSRADSYARLSEIIRKTRLRGQDLETNLSFHYGLLNWFRYRHPWAKPSTRFVVPYLTLVGLLKEEANRFDLDAAWKGYVAAEVKARLKGLDANAAKGVQKKLSELSFLKHTLVCRPLETLIRDPHLMSGWLSKNLANFSYEGNRVVWKENPLKIVAGTYRFLNLDYVPGDPAAQMIWAPDDAILKRGLAFYKALEQRLDCTDWAALSAKLEATEAPNGIEPELWNNIRAAHSGHQFGLGIIGILPLIGLFTRFADLKLNDDLTIHIPGKLLDPELQDRMKDVLVPPPTARADEIVAVSGGMFYSQEAPDRPPFVEPGDHFNAGDALYIIEVMKMFNRVTAPFSGTIERILVEGGEGTIVKKGQPLFKVTPDHQLVEVDPVEARQAKLKRTQEYLDALI